MKHIKSFADACAARGYDPNALPVVTGLPEKHQRAVVVHYMLLVIAEALNEGWEPDWSNNSEFKYYPWPWIKADKDNPAGSGCSYDVCDSAGTVTTVGARLCFKSRELALYALKQFKDLYLEYLLIQKPESTK